MQKEVIETDELVVDDFSNLAKYCKFNYRVRCRYHTLPRKCAYHSCPILGWKSEQRVKITIEDLEATQQ